VHSVRRWKGPLLGLLQSTFGKIVCKLCHSRLMVFSLVNVFLKHSTAFPSPHSRMIFVDPTAFFLRRFTNQLSSHSLLLLLLLFGISEWWTFPPLPVLGTLLIGTLSQFHHFICQLDLVGEVHPQPAFFWGRIICPFMPLPPSTNVWGHFVGKFYPNLFFRDRFDCDFSACVLFLGLIHCWTLHLALFIMEWVS
jgi:hypothetical protein